jgi:hypothetical protein
MKKMLGAAFLLASVSGFGQNVPSGYEIKSVTDKTLSETTDNKIVANSVSECMYAGSREKNIGTSDNPEIVTEHTYKLGYKICREKKLVDYKHYVYKRSNANFLQKWFSNKKEKVFDNASTRYQYEILSADDGIFSPGNVGGKSESRNVAEQQCEILKEKLLLQETSCPDVSQAYKNSQL